MVKTQQDEEDEPEPCGTFEPQHTPPQSPARKVHGDSLAASLEGNLAGATSDDGFRPQFTPEHDAAFDLAAGDSPRAPDSCSHSERHPQKKRMSLSSWWDESDECSGTHAECCQEVDVHEIGSADSPCALSQVKRRGRVSLSQWWQANEDALTLDCESLSEAGAQHPQDDPAASSLLSLTSVRRLLKENLGVQVMQVASPTRRRYSPTRRHSPTRRYSPTRRRK